MSPIAGQTAGPNGLTFFVDTHGWPGVFILFKTFFFPYRQRLALLASNE